VTIANFGDKTPDEAMTLRTSDFFGSTRLVKSDAFKEMTVTTATGAVIFSFDAKDIKISVPDVEAQLTSAMDARAAETRKNANRKSGLTRKSSLYGRSMENITADDSGEGKKGKKGKGKEIDERITDPALLGKVQKVEQRDGSLISFVSACTACVIPDAASASAAPKSATLGKKKSAKGMA
jgi:hypothetical protein